MVLRRWDPVGDLRRMEENMNRLWRTVGVRDIVGEGAESWVVPLDVVQEAEDIVVRASLPGVRPEDVQVTIEDDVLTIKGESVVEQETKEGSYLMRERRAGSFHRSLRLPDTVDTAKADSGYRHGVLTISFPKQEAKKAKRLEVKIKE